MERDYENVNCGGFENGEEAEADMVWVLRRGSRDMYSEELQRKR